MVTDAALIVPAVQIDFAQFSYLLKPGYILLGLSCDRICELETKSLEKRMRLERERGMHFILIQVQVVLP